MKLNSWKNFQFDWKQKLNLEDHLHFNSNRHRFILYDVRFGHWFYSDEIPYFYHIVIFDLKKEGINPLNIKTYLTEKRIKKIETTINNGRKKFESIVKKYDGKCYSMIWFNGREIPDFFKSEMNQFEKMTDGKMEIILPDYIANLYFQDLVEKWKKNPDYEKFYFVVNYQEID